MAPQGFIKHSSAVEADIFSLPVKNIKKRKSKELNPNAPIFKRRKEEHAISIPQQQKPEPEVVVIDSDDGEEAPKHELVTVSDSDDDSVKVCEPRKEIIEVNDSETEDSNAITNIHQTKETEDNNANINQTEGTEDSNLVININQTENVDRIVDSALGRLANTTKLYGDKINVAAEVKEIKRKHRTQVNGYPKSWTKEMIRFYTEPCDDKRNFDYEEILKNLKTKPSDWWINRADKIGIDSGKRRRSYEVCRNCDKYGHTARECRQNIVCHICGEFNHRYTNCPNTLCYTCGKSTSKDFIRCPSCIEVLDKKEPCGLCRQVSHEEFMCPSKWRKHLLLDPSNQTLQINPKRSCYNCGGKGHFGFDCPLTQNSSYLPENPLLTSFPADQNQNNVIFISNDTATLLNSNEGNDLLKRISTDTKCRIELFQREQNPYIRIFGEEDQVQVFKDELEKLKQNSS